MSIGEQVKELRRIANWVAGIPEIDDYGDGGVSNVLMQAADTIEALSAKLAAVHRSGWIPCEHKLPEEKTNPVTEDFYEYQVTYQSEDVTDIRHYKFGNGHWWNDGEIMDAYVIAWRVPIETYHQ